MAPAFSVVIVTHDSARHLPPTLAALERELAPGDELRIVDCASRDDIRAVVGAHAPSAALTLLDENLGFAGGANVGARETTAPLLLFLNPDAVVQPGALQALRRAAEEQPGWGSWQALVTLPGGERINTSGGVTHWLGFGWAGECGEPIHDGRAPGEVSFASGAALVVRREAWQATGGFEAGYWMYGEDLDLALRLRLLGWGVGVVPSARVEHHYEFQKGDYKWFHLERNRWWTVIAAYPAAALALLAPALLAFDLALLLVAARDGWLRAKLRAQVAVLRTLPWALRRRARVQSARRISAAQFAGALSASLDSPYLSGAARLAPLVRLQDAYWRLVRAILRSMDG